MADAIVSVVAEQLISIIKEQIQNELHLVRGVDKELLNLSDELKNIRNVLDDADRRGFKDKSIKDWLSSLEQTSYEMEDVLDEWVYAILKHKTEHESTQKVCSFIPSSCLCFKKVAVRHDIGKKVQTVKGQLDLILAEKDRYNFVMSQPATTDPSPETWRVRSVSLIDLAKVHGRKDDKDMLVSKVVANGGNQEVLGIQIVSIVGGGGLGKTTLAQLVYNDSRVKEYFELRIWVCVSDPFDLAEIAKGIVEGVQGSSPNINQLEMLLQRVSMSVSGKRFLLVLDDVWTEDYNKWEPLENSLKCGGAGSKILVTTRNRGVATMKGTIESEIYYPEQLSDEDCWLVLRDMALLKRNEERVGKFQDIGKKIANKCKGLPLAAKVLGSVLCFKSSLEEWENVLNSEIWQLEKAELELFPHLLLSYNELSPALKRCFSYCAAFPKDSKIDVKKLIGNWMALGYLGSNVESVGDMETKGWEYFQSLAMRSLFQDFGESPLDGEVTSCKMHDVVHDFAQFLRKESNGRVEAVGMKKTTCQSCDPLLVGGIKEYRSLFLDKSPPLNLCNCHTSLRVLGITWCKLRSTPRGIENLIHLRWLDLSCNDLSEGDVKTICKLYNLQTLLLVRCGLKKIPGEIGNLKYLRELDLSRNFHLERLPESICDLHELRTLNVDLCSLDELPEGIYKLINLKHLHNICGGVERFPQGISQLTGLCTLIDFPGGGGRGKLRWLKNLNRLSRYLSLTIELTDDYEDMVEDAREAELRRKIHIQTLQIVFKDKLDEKESSSVRMDVIDALEPHSYLLKLIICGYAGSKLPGWIVSPLNELREIHLSRFTHLTSLPPLGILHCLEKLFINGMSALQFVGREFLGVTTTRDMNIESSSSLVATATTTDTVSFPKLKQLIFGECPNWEEWEDITAEEEESTAFSLLPCLTVLTLENCKGLMALPHRLLHKASSLKSLEISGSAELERRYGDESSSAWKSISQRNPCLQLKLS